MNAKENAAITRMARYQRDWHKQGGYGWPGKPPNAPAVTRYPNLLAELGWSAPWLHLLAEFAGVTQETMAAVLEDNEELSAPELFGLAQYLRANVDYLSAPTLAMIDPAANKGKARLRRLTDLMAQAEELKDKLWWWRIERIRDHLQRGEAVTYASWRWCCQELEDALAYQRSRAKNPRSQRRVKEAAV